MIHLLTFILNIVALAGVLWLVRAEWERKQAREEERMKEARIAVHVGATLLSTFDDPGEPEAMWAMAEQIEAVHHLVPTTHQVRSAWRNAVRVAAIKLGPLAGFTDRRIVDHARQVAAELYALGRAAWRGDGVEALLLGEGYRIAAHTIESTIVRQWPRDAWERDRMMEKLQARGRAPSALEADRWPAG